MLLLALAVAGQGVRLWLGRAGSAGPPGDIQFSARGGSTSLAAHRDSAAQAGLPLGKGERVDLDRAGAGEIARLPRVGPGLARRIVADRGAHGAFGSLEGFSRVPGVGEGLLAAVRDHVVFSGHAAPRDDSLSPPPLDLNAATEAELERLPGIGPSLARRIIEYRGRHGPFAGVDSLGGVWGIGPRSLERLKGLLIVH
ncbi:MAG: ComEA family DNA-binding protein [Gemmatimonadales bacterium]